MTDTYVFQVKVVEGEVVESCYLHFAGMHIYATQIV